MTWSIADVARMSGVTARTLRHYHDIGILPPARVGANGYRYYEQPQLLRLQRILLMRELGMNLATIAEVLAGGQDELRALREHHRHLLAERDRMDRLVRTVARTISRLEGGDAMPAEQMFEGFRFTPQVLDELEADAVACTGQEDQPYFDQVRRATADWTPEQFAELTGEGAEVERRLRELMETGVPVDDPAVFAVLDDDLASQHRVWSPNRQEYTRLGEAFAGSARLRAHLDAQHPHLADYLRDAMAAYARARLT